MYLLCINSTNRATAILFALLFSLQLPVSTAQAEEEQTRTRPFRILHVMSYHSGWEWNDTQLQGFKDAVTGLDYELEIFEMDTKRNSSEDWKLQKAVQARALIEDWQPDLVYANDDNAQEHIVRHYVGTEIPFVFSGVNAEPTEYGFTGNDNVTGVLEREHSLQSVALLRKLVPSVHRIAVVVDDGPTWPGVIREMRKQLDKLDNLEVVEWRVVKTFSDYKELINSYQERLDAVALLGVFTYKDESGQNVPFENVLRWTVENSSLPDFSFWNSRVTHGTLCAVAVSGYAQGYAAGEYARAILIDNESPSDLPMIPTRKGNPMINLARARELGIMPDSSILLATEVVTEFHWEK